jgi:hypothetical protein
MWRLPADQDGALWGRHPYSGRWEVPSMVSNREIVRRILADGVAVVSADAIRDTYGISDTQARARQGRPLTRRWVCGRPAC